MAKIHLALVVPLLFLVTGPAHGAYKVSNFRLPTIQVPSLYALNLDLKDPSADTIKATSAITVNFTEKSTEVILNADPSSISLTTLAVKVDTAKATCQIISSNATTQLFAVNCTQDLFGSAATKTLVTLDYTTKYSDDMMGLYKTQFTTANGNQSSVIYSQFEPTYFRRVFASMDEPALKAKMALTIQYNTSNWVFVSNMDQAKSDKTSTTFKETPIMSTYLLAIVGGPIADWDSYPASGKHAYNFSVFAQKTYEDYLSLALEYGPALLDTMGTWTGLTYEKLGNTKMTIAAVPRMDDATENWGLISIDERFLVDEGTRTTQKQIEETVMILAHELAHQWIGNYVTMEWWSEVSLNEGLTTYFQWYLSDMVLPKMEFSKKFLITTMQPALSADGLDVAPLVKNDSTVSSQEEISSTVENQLITYHKGASLVRMIRDVLTEDVFKKAIQSYLKTYALGTATHSDLIAQIQAALPKDVKIDLSTYLDAWIHQPGYPILKTSVNSTSDKNNYVVTVDINKFSTLLNKTSKPEKSVWYVPVTYNSADNSNVTTTWVEPGKSFSYKFIKSANPWTILNVKAHGYYRVDYDDTLLSMLLVTLNDSKTYKNIEVENRAQILDDLFNIAKYYTKENQANLSRPYMNAFDVASYLKYETEYYPWYTFLKEVQYLLDEIESDTTLEALKAFVLNLVQKQLVIPTDANSKNVTHSEILKRNLVLTWAGKLGDKDVSKYAQTEYAKFKKNTTSINSDYRDVILCIGLKNSKNATSEYEDLLGIYAKSIVPRERQEIIESLSCVADTKLETSILTATLGDKPPIAKEYWGSLFNAVYQQGPEGLDVAVQFLTGNIFGIINKWKGVTDIESMFVSLGSKIVTTHHITMLGNALMNTDIGSSVGKSIGEALLNVAHNVEWIQSFGKELESVIVYGGEPGPAPTTTTKKPTSSPDNGNTDEPSAATVPKYRASEIVLLTFGVLFVMLKLK